MTEQAQAANPILAEAVRGPVVECVHRGTLVVAGAGGGLELALGDADRVILPRSSVKPLQALAMLESGAAEDAGLTDRHLALACASHHATPEHVDLVAGWLSVIGAPEAALRCGAHAPLDAAARRAMTRAGEAPGQRHNQCSGKHVGFLTAMRRLGGDGDYVAPGHPVQRAVAAATGELCDFEVREHAVDGCSAPNFAVSMRGLATAMARMATARPGDGRAAALVRLREAMAAHPHLVAAHGSPTTELMRACPGAAIKSGAAGVFLAALPGLGLGVALKIDDGDAPASAAAMAAVLARLGVLAPDHPTHARLAGARIVNWRGIDCGHLRPGPDLA